MSTARHERDALGECAVPADALWGVHTQRALENFPIARRPVHRDLVAAYGVVKQACVRTARAVGTLRLDAHAADALEAACEEMGRGALTDHVRVDALQGGAGTSLNMCVNEVLANRALQLLGEPLGNYERVSPLDHVNVHQSTNDTFPTAVRLAALRGVDRLEKAVVALQEAFQEAERRFSDVVVVGRTQLQDAVLLTVGRQLGAVADALSRDRWRIYKCAERLRVVNLGGTAVGTGVGAPRRYVLSVVDTLRDLTGYGFARAENLVDATRHADVFSEVSGMVRTLATTLLKAAWDLRVASASPVGELRLPPVQAGSSIMPGKVNPVIPEAVTQAAMQVLGYDQVIANACGMGVGEINPFLPLVADNLLTEIDVLAAACDVLRTRCVAGLQVDAERCAQRVEGAVATATALVGTVGYQTACRIAEEAQRTGRTIRQVAVEGGFVTEEQFDALVHPAAVCRLGDPS